MPSARMRSSSCLQRRRLGRVHAGRGLVEREQLGLGRERARDFQPALVAVGQVLGEIVLARSPMPT